MIGLISINHKTASLSRRELFALTSEEATALVRLWKEEEGVAGAIVLSTCNRLEIYYDSSEKITRELESRLLESLYRFKQVRHRGDESIFVTARHDEAVLHLFRLASGLESMVLGETQILGQIKEAYRQATAAGQTTSVLSRLCHRTFETAKRVRSEYLLSATPISAGAAAVDLLYEHLPDFLDRRVLILGAGQMAEVITDRLRELEHPAFALYNRTKSRAESFATKHGITSVYSEDQLPEALASHDITFVATSSLSPIVTQEVLPHEPRAQVFFDLAVPRNVDPALEEYHHLHLYTIDDLRRKGGQLLHPQDQGALSSYLESMVSDFIQWCEAAEVREVIGLIQQVSQQILHKELSHLPSTLDEETKALIGQWDEHLRITYTTAIVSALRELSEESSTSKYSEALRLLFTHIHQTLPPL